MRGMVMQKFLTETKHIDFSESIITRKANELFRDAHDEIAKTRIAFEFVRDEIPHSFDIDATIVTAKASDVLRFGTGICHAKANLLATLLRLQGIPTGFCFQRLTLADDDSLGYCVHCYNAVWLNGHWVRLDARGNTNGKNAKFSLDEPILAFQNRPQYDEYFWPGIYAKLHNETMLMLEKADSMRYVLDNLPDMLTGEPDVFQLFS